MAFIASVGGGIASIFFGFLHMIVIWVMLRILSEVILSIFVIRSQLQNGAAPKEASSSVVSGFAQPGASPASSGYQGKDIENYD